MSRYILTRGAVKACAGIVESAANIQPYADYIKNAERAVGRTFSPDPAAQAERARLIEAIKLNLINRRENNFELLVRRFSLPVSLSMFKREKYKFCYALAVECGFVQSEKQA